MATFSIVLLTILVGAPTLMGIVYFLSWALVKASFKNVIEG